jgi:MoxR-like ATPase
MNITKLIDRIERKIESCYRGEIEGRTTRVTKTTRNEQIIFDHVKPLLKQESPLLKPEIFDAIIGYPDVKAIMKNMLINDHPISILLDGSPGCGKSMFLKQIEKFYPQSTRYVDGSGKTTKAGIFDILFADEENEIRYLVIDEVDKLNTTEQEALLTLIEDGRIIQTQKSGTMEKQYSKLSIIAASNVKEDILEPLQTRFYKIKIKDYTEAQFKEIAASILPQYKLSQEVIEHIITSVWTKKKKPNIRDIKNIAKLCNNSIDMVNLLLENSV